MTRLRSLSKKLLRVMYSEALDESRYCARRQQQF